MNVDLKTKILVLSKTLQELTKDLPQKQVLDTIKRIHNETVQEIYDKTIKTPSCDYLISFQ
jgi:hypothetical protein